MGVVTSFLWDGYGASVRVNHCVQRPAHCKIQRNTALMAAVTLAPISFVFILLLSSSLSCSYMEQLVRQQLSNH